MVDINSAVSKMSGDRPNLRPVTTLFMLTSVDGKISYASVSENDFNVSILSGKRKSDYWYMCSGKSKDAVGINHKYDDIKKRNENIAIIDSTYLTLTGLTNLLRQYNEVVLFTNNARHPACLIEDEHLTAYLMTSLNERLILIDLYEKHGCKEITIQTDPKRNSDMITECLIDYLDVIVAPIVAGGVNMPHVLDGRMFETVSGLSTSVNLEFVESEVVGEGYVYLRYKVKR